MSWARPPRFDASAADAAGVVTAIAVVTWVEARDLFVGGIPWGGDGYSHLAAAVAVRRAIVGGRLPTSPDLFYGTAYSPVFHVFSKILYPGWWPVYVPGLPLGTVLPAVLAAHGLVAIAVAYWHLRSGRAKTGIGPVAAGALAAVAGLALATFDGHNWKWLALPWVWLALGRCLPWYSRTWEPRDGRIVGVALGMIALTGGGIYLLGPVGAVVGGVGVVHGDRDWWADMAAYSAIGVLKIGALAASVGSRSYPSEFWYVPGDVLWILAGDLAPVFELAVPVGVAGLGLATLGGGATALQSDADQRIWWGGLVAGSLAVLAFTVGVHLHLDIPAADSLRTATRGILILQAVVVLAIAAVVDAAGDWGAWPRRVVLVLVVLTAVQSAVAVADYTTPHGPADPTAGERIAASVPDACDSVWVDRQSQWDLHRPLRQAQVTLVQDSTAIRNPVYPPAGVPHPPARDGQLTVDAIVTETAPGEGPITLRTHPWQTVDHRVETDGLRYRGVVPTKHHRLHLYTTGC